MREINVTELAQWRTSGRTFMLLDVREPHELATAAIAGSHHIPMREIPGRTSELPKDQEIVVMCHHGARSARVAGFLETQGFTNVINLDGGIDAWSKQIDPSVANY